MFQSSFELVRQRRSKTVGAMGMSGVEALSLAAVRRLEADYGILHTAILMLK